jgi:predicted O-methyltransferase YrrM
MIKFILLDRKKSNKYIYSSKEQNNNKKDDYNTNMRKYDINFNYEDYDSEIITEKMRRYSGWLIGLGQAKFINGIIRKHKLKNCLEIGVAHGGSSILILNSIKDMKNSILVSLDLNKELFRDKNILTGYRVNKYFPELTKNWKLYTGDQPHKFLIHLNIKFDFLFLDSAHVSPGEILNFIEALPFLNENAVVVIHDLLWHFGNAENTKFFPACIALLPTLYGDKVFTHSNNEGISNMAAIFLYPNQKEHYLNYFLLLLNFWEYIPKDNQILDLRQFIKKYYKDKIYIDIFDLAVRKNKNVTYKFMKYINQKDEKKYLVSLGTKWNITSINNQ